MSVQSIKESRGSYLDKAAKELTAAASEASFDATTFFEKFELLAETSGAIAKLRQIVLHIAFKGGLTKRSGENRDEQLLAKIDADVDLLAGKKRSQSKRQMVESSEQPFVIPDTWQWTTLGRIGNWGSGSTPKRGTSEYYNGTFSWLKSGELNDVRNLKGSEEKVTEIAIKQCSFRLNQKGDILFAMYGATVGKVAILGEEAVTNQAVCGCTPSRYVDNVFLYFYLISQRQTFRDTSEGGAQPNFSKDKIVNFPFPVPPLAEQKRIVAKVDELMGLCDRLEALEAERNDRHASLSRAALARFAASPTRTNLQFLFHKSYDIGPAELRKSILTLAVRGKLVEGDESEEPVDHLLVQMQRHRKLLIDEKKIRKPCELPHVAEEESPFSVPDKWRWARWGQICDWITYGFTRPMAHVNNGPPIVTAKNVQDGFLTFENSHRADANEFANLNPKDLPRKGDILITKDGTIGRAAIVNTDEAFCINQSVAVLWLGSCLLYRPFLLMVIRSPFAQGPIWEAAEGMAIKHLSITDFGKMILPLPPYDEQRRIVAKVDELMALVDQLEQQLAHSRTLGQQLLEAVVAKLTN